MSRDSRLVLSCNKEDTLNIGNSVSKALSDYARTKLDDYCNINTTAPMNLGLLVFFINFIINIQTNSCMYI